jgi:hypothetical protein
MLRRDPSSTARTSQGDMHLKQCLAPGTSEERTPRWSTLPAIARPAEAHGQLRRPCALHATFRKLSWSLHRASGLAMSRVCSVSEEVACQVPGEKAGNNTTTPPSRTRLAPRRSVPHPRKYRVKLPESPCRAARRPNLLAGLAHAVVARSCVASQTMRRGACP